MTEFKELFSWESFNRPTHLYTKRGLTIIVVLAVVFSIFFILFQEWLATVVTWGALFLFIALDRMPAEKVKHKITTEGLVSMNHSYIWPDLGPFWFKTSGENRVLHIARKNIFDHLVILVNPENEEEIRNILIGYLPYIEVPEKSFSDRVMEWVNQG